MKNFFQAISFAAVLGLLLSPAGFCEDHAHTGRPNMPAGTSNSAYGSNSSNWEKAMNTQKNVDRLTSSGQVSSLSKVPKRFNTSEVYQSEHSANPLSRPGSDGMIAVRQAEQALESSQAAGAPRENASEAPE